MSYNSRLRSSSVCPQSGTRLVVASCVHYGWTPPIGLQAPTTLYRFMRRIPAPSCSCFQMSWAAHCRHGIHRARTARGARAAAAGECGRGALVADGMARGGALRRASHVVHAGHGGVRAREQPARANHAHAGTPEQARRLGGASCLDT